MSGNSSHSPAAQAELVEALVAHGAALCFIRPPMVQGVSLQQARAILGNDVVGIEELRAALGDVEGVEGVGGESVPFTVADLERARAEGQLLILRAPRVGGEPLTLLSLIRRFPDLFDPAQLRKVGYQLRDEWGIELEPLAGTDTCAPRWALVRKELLPESINRSYDEDEAILDTYGAEQGAAGKVRRRTAIEIAFDLVVYYRARGQRLLPKSWDWSSSRTVDGGFLNIGRFNEAGVQVFSYSRAVRHGQLGVCPNRDPVD